MADIPARTSEIGVTTGPIRGSKKIYVGPRRVAMREIYLDPSCDDAPVRVYDPSGPYTDSDAHIDISDRPPRNPLQLDPRTRRCRAGVPARSPPRR